MTSSLPPLRSIAERLAHLRSHLGLTRAELAARLQGRGSPHASVMSIRRNESGDRSPTVAELAAIADLAEVSPAWIIDGRGDGPPEFGVDDRQLIVGHLQAELTREEESEGPVDAQKAFERVEARLNRRRRDRTLGDGAWAYWLAVRQGAVLFGGYRPPVRSTEEPSGG